MELAIYFGVSWPGIGPCRIESSADDLYNTTRVLRKEENIWLLLNSGNGLSVFFLNSEIGTHDGIGILGVFITVRGDYGLDPIFTLASEGVIGATILQSIDKNHRLYIRGLFLDANSNGSSLIYRG